MRSLAQHEQANKLIAHVLSDIRAQSDVKQSELAATLQMGQSALSELERGTRHILVSDAIMYALGTGVKPSEMYQVVEQTLRDNDLLD